ncbi:hypothetical protein COO60DRAFT_1192457 [Scenedesmus sp. NREL 46B-D3]|nr:hypothetical protein COO60DRAFT_1192457 [Scenedesmus sp. NREL 46B-D3]
MPQRQLQRGGVARLPLLLPTGLVRRAGSGGCCLSRAATWGLLWSDEEVILLRYLPQVGPATARSIVDKFGSGNVQNVLNSTDAAERLSAICGTGDGTAEDIKKEWDASARTYQDLAWLTRHQVHGSCHASLLQLHGSGAALRSALSQNPYAPIGAVKRYKLRHAEAVGAALKCRAGAPERAAAVLLHVLHAASSSGSHGCGLTWQQLQQTAIVELADLGSRHGRPWPAGQSLRPRAELLARAGKIVAEEAKLLPDQHGSRRTAAGVTPVSSGSNAATTGSSSQQQQQQQQAAV